MIVYTCVCAYALFYFELKAGDDMKKKILRFLDGFLTVFLLAMLVLNFYNILQRNVMDNQMPKIFGYGYAVVISGSMEPEISVNDIVYVKEQDSYAVGDIITYEKYDSYITHRIIDIVDGEYVTKGDSNNTKDQDTVMLEQVRGKVVFVLPVFGAMVLYMKTPIGTLVTLLIALICLEVPYRIRLSRARKKGKKKYKRIARDMERIQTEIKKLDEEAAANPEMPQQRMVVDDPELQYQTFLEQMLQAESINDIRLPGGLAPAKPLEGEVVIGGSTEADDDYVNRVAAKNAREKVEAERAALLAQGYTFASNAEAADGANGVGCDTAVGTDDGVNAGNEINAAFTDETHADGAADFEGTDVSVASASPVELTPGSAMAAMMSIASAMNTDLGLTYEDFEKGNEELLKLEAELSGVPLDEPEVIAEETVEEVVGEGVEGVVDGVSEVSVDGSEQGAYQPSAEAEAYAQAQVEEAYAEITATEEFGYEEQAIDEEEAARLRRIAEIEAELTGVPYEEPEIVAPVEYVEQSEETYTEAAGAVEYTENAENTESVEYAQTEYAEYVETPQIDEEELERLRRIAQIESELYGTEYVDPLETMNLQGVPAEMQEVPEEFVPDSPVEYSPEEIVEYAEAAEEYAEVVTEEEVSNEQFAVTDFVPEEPQGYEAAGGYVIDEGELARLRRIAEIEAELYGTEYVDPLETMQAAQVVTDDEFTVDTTVSDEYAEIMAEEYVPDTLVGYEAAEYVEEPEIVEQVIVSEELNQLEEVVEETAEAVVPDEPVVESFAGEPVEDGDSSDDGLTWSESSAEFVPEELEKVALSEEEEQARLKRIAEIEAELAGVPYVDDDIAEADVNIEDDVDPEEAERLARIAEIEAELAASPEVSPKKQAMMAAREERKHKRAVDRHSRKGPPVYIPEEGVWNIAVDEYSLEDVLGEEK